MSVMTSVFYRMDKGTVAFSTAWLLLLIAQVTQWLSGYEKDIGATMIVDVISIATVLLALISTIQLMGRRLKRRRHKET